MTTPRVFGKISQVAVGTVFENRAELATAGVHRPLVAGISGAAKEGCDSIVVSGGYEDDEDYGDIVIYTGHGGNHPGTGKQVDHQHWSHGNLALRVSQAAGLPVRVIRGHRLDSPYAPDEGFRYDGLYFVEQSWRELGHSGFQVCRFRLIRDDIEAAPWYVSLPSAKPPRGPVPRIQSTIQRLVRNTAVAQNVKLIHDFRCQICCQSLVGPAGPYAEGAHIKPLGRPHDGPDIPENVLCLCPNCHVLFDLGAISITSDFSIEDHCGTQREGRTLHMTPKHIVGAEFLEYHRNTFASCAV